MIPQSLAGVRIALIVEDTGWRNTTAFELGVKSMGGICAPVPVSLDGAEAIEDLARYLDNWFDMIVVRTRELARLREFATAARAPVVNARTRDNHPCEVLGDLAFAVHEGKALPGLKVSVVAPHANILRSWIEAASILPITVVQVFPQQWQSSRSSETEHFATSTNLAAIAPSDIVVTDCWPRAGLEAELLPFQVTADILARHAPQALFIPCPPVTRGQEVSGEVMSAPQCRTFEAKAFLLHAQNALLEAKAASFRR